MEDVSMAAVCDRNDENLADAQVDIADADEPAAEEFDDHETMLEAVELDAVIVATSWRPHIPLAIKTLESDIYVATEVGPASTVEECWRLVRAAESSQAHAMLLENDCYKEDMLMALQMVRDGLFGELINTRCGYLHDLRALINESHEIGRRSEGTWYRTLHNLKRNGDIYPTHGVGPISKYLGITRGNRFLSLKSTATKSRGLHEWAAENLDADHPAQEYDWAMGDVITTTITCANGETVNITHDVALPRPKETQTLVQGTKGLWRNTDDSIYIDGRSPDHEWEPFEDYQAEYGHPLWRQYRERGLQGGHGGIDFLVLRDFLVSVKHDARPPIDAYEFATWRAISPLSEASIANGGEPVSFPDFTNGAWMNREPEYAFDEPREGRPPVTAILDDQQV